MSVAHDTIQSGVEEQLQDNWSGTVVFKDEPGAQPAPGADEYIEVSFEDVTEIRDSYGDLQRARGNLVIRLFSARNRGRKYLRTQVQTLATLISSLNASGNAGVIFGAARFSHVKIDDGTQRLMALYVVPFASVASA